ncbi:MAG: PAS domain-containing sensor histidine kinase [Candidatus Magnetobacterium sp. LHC-1]|uniref:histidine kinase n=1 Tax=Candidatus Magnetobacterium casense TaxID=1455061 RepID=A0ABS6RXM4_9BACT|nr:PAS domain-containing sensor histidine kinase [Candidatus Magnetobacterium casensis]MBF0607782.1 PAS domain-containing sensor histidine kinase [Nitrospirota bacterium]MBV6341110.1 PAS domain-containing sensor histidine kinase [Candidatus Magnetobacterium casensis]
MLTIALSIFVVLPLADVFLVYPAFINLMVKNTEDEAVRVARHMSVMLSLKQHEVGGILLTNNFSAQVRELMDDFNIVKVKLFSTEGKVLFSTAIEDVGKINKAEYFRDTVLRGRAYTKLVKKGKQSLESQRYTADVIETYVPIVKDGKVIGAFEIYYDVTNRKAAIDRLLSRSYVMFFVMVFVYMITIIATSLRSKAKEEVQTNDAQEKQSVAKLVTIMVIALFATEIVIMLLLHHVLPPLPGLMGSFVDGILLVIIVNPLLYIFCFKPMLAQISVRQRAEQMSREKSIYLDCILNSSTDMGIIATDIDLYIKYYNQEAERLLGFKKDEVLGKTVTQMHKLANVAPLRFSSTLERLRKTETHNFAIQLKKDDGVCFIEARVSGIWDEQTTLVGYVMMIKDVTRQRAEQERMRRLIRSVESAGESVVITDTSGVIEYVNPSFTKLTGYEARDVIGGKPNLLKSGLHSANFYKGLWDTILGGEVWHGELTNKRKDGSLYDAQLTVAPVFADSDNKIEGFIAIQRDISELKALHKSLAIKVENGIRENQEQQQMLVQQSKMAAMGEMIGAIAHQWRQPLNGLGVMIQDVIDAYEYGELNKEYLDNFTSDALKQISFMSNTIDDFRNFFRPSKEKAEFSVVRTIRKVIDIVRAMLYTNNINLRLTGEEDITVTGYRNEFMQVMLNLINNARDAILQSREHKDTQDGLISIDVSRDSAVVRIEIKDNGGGIPDDIRNKLFEPYFTTKGEGHGTGIGLHLSRVIIERNMGGRLYADNDAEGAVFTIEVSR